MKKLMEEKRGRKMGQVDNGEDGGNHKKRKAERQWEVKVGVKIRILYLFLLPASRSVV